MDTGLDRRSFLCGVAAVLGVPLTPRTVAGQQVPPDDGRLMSERVKAPAGLLVRPRPRAGTGVFVGPERYASVLLVHETRGLDAWVENMARRAALESFMVFAPEARGIEELHASAVWLKTHPQSTGRLGVLGFSSTRDLAGTLAGRIGADLQAAVIFHGVPSPAANVARLKASVQLHEGGEAAVEAAWERAALWFIKSLT